MTIQTFRKKPIEIQAVQWTGDNEREIREWCGPSMFGALPLAVHRDPEITAEVLDTLHSTWVGVKTGQWIVRGVKGEYYPIAEDVLAETYEPVADAEPATRTCTVCNGTGLRRDFNAHGEFESAERCGACDGTGRVASDAEGADADAPTCRDCGTWPCARHATDADRAEYAQATSDDSTAAESVSAS